MMCPWEKFPKFTSTSFCEEQICGWVVQPANTWSNISYLIAAIYILQNKNFDSNKYWFAPVVLFLFFGSTAYHMTNTVWGHWTDLAGMLALSGLILSLTIVRFFKLRPIYLALLLPVILAFSLPHIGPSKWGGKIFFIQCMAAAIVEIFTFKARQISSDRRTWIVRALGLFLFALAINIVDMKQYWCIPQNHVITLHAIWHLICGYCIYLVAKYYCYKDQVKA